MQTLRGVTALALMGIVACSSSEPSDSAPSSSAESASQGGSALVTEIATQPGRGQLALPAEATPE